MNARYFMIPILCGLAFALSSCRKGGGSTAENLPPPPIIAPELLTNGVASFPGAVYRSQADSPIRWQPWTKISFKRAKDARRLIFCAVAMPQQPGFQNVLAALGRDSAVVTILHDQYVPILVDGDASREVGLLTADLCAEIKRPLQLPLFVWMTHEGNPVAWIPVPQSSPAAVQSLFNQSHQMVLQMWKDAPDYVLKNSALDNTKRRERMAERKISKIMSEQPAIDLARSIRQLSSLYDPSSRSFDDIGGLLPSGAIELLATAAVHPGLPADVRNHALETTRNLLTDLLPSPMFDPLDGGVFLARRGVTWALPTFNRDCPGQARAAVALLQAYRATGDPKVLEKAIRVISFAEKSYLTAENLFGVGLRESPAAALWMWTVEDIQKALAPEDAAWWIKATGMTGIGNLPSELDPRREYFRANTIGLSQTVAEIAAAQSLTIEAFSPRFEAAKARLLAVRNARFGKPNRDDCAHAGATFRMVSAYSAAFGVTGDERYREKAIALLKRAREAFGVGPRLRTFSKDAPDSVGAGRAFCYALALEAVLDVATISSDDSWLFWSEDLATTAAELFTGNAFLKECPDEAKLLDLPITDLVMLFDDSTGGLVSSTECRLAALGRPLVASFSELATPMPVYALERPVLHTDLLLATLARQYSVHVVRSADSSPALKLAIERLPMRVIQRRPVRPEDAVPPGAVKVILSTGESRIVTTPEALQEAVLPSLSK